MMQCCEIPSWQDDLSESFVKLLVSTIVVCDAASLEVTFDFNLFWSLSRTLLDSPYFYEDDVDRLAVGPSSR